MSSVKSDIEIARAAKNGAHQRCAGKTQYP